MCSVRYKKKGFTLVELLTVLAIITMLVGLLVPSLRTVRRFAKETKQRAQLGSIETALTAFRSDYGDYPPSDNWDYEVGDSLNYSGAQRLCEALLGWDLMGFHPDSAWRADGLDIGGGGLTYDPDRVRGDDSLYERRGRYLELRTANAFRLGNIPADNKPGLFVDPTPLAGDTFVLCDVFGATKVAIGSATVQAGAPILYYRANTYSKTIAPSTALYERIYEATDNQAVIKLGDHPLGEEVGGDYPYFYNYIRDLRVAGIWPYRPDSYILITAGADGIYGTADDICNFGN